MTVTDDGQVIAHRDAGREETAGSQSRFWSDCATGAADNHTTSELDQDRWNRGELRWPDVLSGSRIHKQDHKNQSTCCVAHLTPPTQ